MGIQKNLLKSDNIVFVYDNSVIIPNDLLAGICDFQLTIVDHWKFESRV